MASEEIQLAKEQNVNILSFIAIEWRFQCFFLSLKTLPNSLHSQLFSQPFMHGRAFLSKFFILSFASCLIANPPAGQD